MSAPSCERRRPARRTLLDRLCALHPERARERWYAAVACGEVLVDGERVRDPQRLIAAGAVVAAAAEPPLASRAGYKLRHALDRFAVPVAGKVVLDAGAAAGGFSDCLLRRGARHVHCVDVARGALAWRLRRDPRTSVHERTNVMHLAGGSLQPPPDGAVCDLAFRSLRGAAPRLLGLTRENWLIALIKPQFELAAAHSPPGARARLDRGVVDGGAVAAVVAELLRDLAAAGVAVQRCAPAPVRGRRGNREVLALLTGGCAVTAAAAAWPPAVAALRRELQQVPAGAAGAGAGYGRGPEPSAARLIGSPM